MRVSDVYDATAIDQLCALGYLNDLGELSFSFKKLVKKVGRPWMKVHRKVFKPIRRVFTKKFFLRAAPFLSIAAQLLNFVVPGLGVAVSIAISLSATALALKEKNAMKKKAKAMDKAAEAQANAEVAKADQEANASLDKAYATGQDYFTKTYHVTPDVWQKKTIDQKIRFLNVALYDRNHKNMEAIGVARDDFQKMSIAQQHDALAKGAESLKGEAYTSSPAEVDPATATSVTDATSSTSSIPAMTPAVAAQFPAPEPGVTLAPSFLEDNSGTILAVGGGLLVLLLGYLIYRRQTSDSSFS